MTEKWKDITGYEGSYQISSYGKVKSLTRTIKYNDGRSRVYKGKKLSPGKSSNGYYTVNLWKNGNRNKTFLVHRLVAQEFIGNCPRGLVVDHIDNDKGNNKLNNLQYVTIRENVSKDRKNKTSKYTGVSWSSAKNKWLSSITFNRVNYHLGYYDIEEEAHNAYQKKLKEKRP